MLLTVNRQLRRHRRTLLWALALLAVVTVALTARSALMSTHGHGGGETSGAVTLCLTIGACAAVAGAAVFAIRRMTQRPLWRIPSPVAPAVAFVPTSPGFLVRAGPSPLLQVFRL